MNIRMYDGVWREVELAEKVYKWSSKLRYLIFLFQSKHYLLKLKQQ